MLSKAQKSIPYLLVSALFFFFAVSPANSQTKKAAPQKKAAKSLKTAKAAHRVTGEGRVLGPAETLSGTVASVNADAATVVVTGSNGVPYNFKWTRRTMVKISNARAKTSELADQVNKQVSIKFVPKTNGNYAESIEIGG